MAVGLITRIVRGPCGRGCSREQFRGVGLKNPMDSPIPLLELQGETMSAFEAAKERALAEMEHVLTKAGLNPRSKKTKERAWSYQGLRDGLIDAGYSEAEADEFISRFLYHHITKYNISSISTAISRARGMR